METKKTLLQQWWEEKHPRAGVKNVYEVSEGVLSNEQIFDFEKWMEQHSKLKDNDIEELKLMNEKLSKALSDFVKTASDLLCKSEKCNCGNFKRGYVADRIICGNCLKDAPFN